MAFIDYVYDFYLFTSIYNFLFLRNKAENNMFKMSSREKINGYDRDVMK